MIFRVTKQFPRGPETDLQKFMKREMAVQFITEKLAEDALYKLQTIYRLYDDLDHLLKEYTTADLEKLAGSNKTQESNSGAGKDGGQRFSPSPFNTAPRPGGIPPSSFRKDDSEDKDKDK